MRLLRVTGVFAVVLVACASPRRAPTEETPAVGDGGANSPGAVGREWVSTDLTEVFREGAIDTSGTVIDLGERQSHAWLANAAVFPVERLNGDSWVSVGTRLRMRVSMHDLADGEPTSVRLRLRRATSRRVGLIVDGLLVRTSMLAPGDRPTVLSLPVPPRRFTRAITDVELRFSPPRVVPGVLSPITAQVDWVHIARREVPPARVADLVSDVAIERTPRRALTFYAPTRLSSVMILPRDARLVASLAAEGPRGARAAAPVVARMRVDVDGDDPVETRVEVSPNRPWMPCELDLARFAGRPARITLSADGAEESRLAIATPSLLHRAEAGETTQGSDAPRSPTARHVVMVVVRGLRVDRVLPTVSTRLLVGGLARIAREGTVARAQAPAPREFSALISTTTGLGADVHRVSELTDALDDEAPTLGTVASGAGISTAAYTDDVAWIGSGADRGFVERHSCPGDVAACRPDWMFSAVADAIVARRDAPSLSLVLTRAGVLPLDPSNENVTALDPRPYEGTMTPSRTALYAVRGRSEAVGLTPPDQERLSLLYDAALLSVDRGLATLLDRLRDQGLDGDTTIIVVGDRGSALGEHRTVGDGPLTLPTIAETLLMVRGRGYGAYVASSTVSTLDAAVTALDALGIAAPSEFDGRAMLRGAMARDRVLAFVANGRWELGLRFGEALAMPRPLRDGGGIALFAHDSDPLCQSDVALSQPIARGFVEARLAELRPGAGRRLFPPTTRVLPAPLDALLRFRR